MKRLLICSLNAPSLLKYKDGIDMLLHDNHIDILALNETRLAPFVSDLHVMIKNYSIPVRCDCNRQGGGVAIYVKDTVLYKMRDNLPIGGLGIVCIEVSLDVALLSLSWHDTDHQIMISCDLSSLNKFCRFLIQKIRK